MTVGEMLSKMSSLELIEWKAFLSLEAKEHGNANATKTMMNSLSGKKGRRLRH